MRDESSSPTVKKKRVPFKACAPEAQQVMLVADFNDWSDTARPLKKDAKGVWKTTVTLAPGRYAYRFLIDGEWVNDPNCDEEVPNDYGSHNCIKVVA